MRLPIALKLTDKNLYEIFLGSGISFFIKFFAALSTFFLNLYVTRFYGVEQAGVFFFYLSIVYILSGVATLGMETAVVKFLSLKTFSKNSLIIRNIVNRVLFSTFVLSIFFIILLVIATITSIEGFIIIPYATYSVVLLPFSILSISISIILGASFQGLKKVASSSIVNSLSIPLLTIIFIWLINDSSSIATLVICFTASSFLTIIFGYYYWISITRNKIKKSTDINFNWIDFNKSRGPFFIISIMNMIIIWLPNIILGFYVDESQVAIYNAAMRTSMILSFIHISVSVISAPKFSELFSQQDYFGLDKAIKFSSFLMIVIGVIPLTLMIFFSKSIMGYFGDGLSEGYLILIILSIGQFINVIFSSYFHVNLMSGDEKKVRDGLLISTFLGTLIGFFMISTLGTIALAYGTLISIVMLSAFNLNAYLKRKKVNLNL